MTQLQLPLDLDRGLSLPRLPSIVNDGVGDRLSTYLFNETAQPSSQAPMMQPQQQQAAPRPVSQAPEPDRKAAVPHYAAVCTTGYQMRSAPERPYHGGAVTTNHAVSSYQSVTTAGHSPSASAPQVQYANHGGTMQMQSPVMPVTPMASQQPFASTQQQTHSPMTGMVPMMPGDNSSKSDMTPAQSPFGSMASQAFSPSFGQSAMAANGQMSMMGAFYNTVSGGSQGSGTTGHADAGYLSGDSDSGRDIGELGEGDKDEDYTYPGSPGRQPTRRSLRRRGNRNTSADEGGQIKPKNKVGRPIAYNGDPNSPTLTEAERRRIKRRIANRESARRVRQKRQDVLEEMNTKMQGMQAQHMQLLQHLHASEQHKQAMFAHLAECKQKWKASLVENAALKQELAQLRSRLHAAAQTAVPKVAAGAGSATTTGSAPMSPSTSSPTSRKSGSPPATPTKASDVKVQASSPALPAGPVLGADVAPVPLLEIPTSFGSMELVDPLGQLLA